MVFLQTLPLALLFCILALHQVQGQEALAMFNGKGFTGYVQFSKKNSNIRVFANVMGLRGSHNWHVHNFPVDQTVDPYEQCSTAFVGPHYDPFNANNGSTYSNDCSNNPSMCEAGDLSGKFGPLLSSSNMPVDEVDSAGTLFLRGANSIVGRSVVIHNHESPFAPLECATIRSMAEADSEVVLLQASFISNIAGTMYFKQVEGEDVQMWGKMFWVNDKPTTFSHSWNIHSLAPDEGYRTGMCGSILTDFKPLGSGLPSVDGDTCNSTMTSGCGVGDLSGKFGLITVSGKPSPYSSGAFFYTDTFLNLTGENAVVNRSVAIHMDGGGSVIACAPLIASEKISLMQYGVGEVTVYQNSPFEDTVITTTNTREMTVVQNSVLSPTVLDCPNSSDAVFSPYMVEDSQVGGQTPDQISLGNLHTRYPGVNGAGTVKVLDVPVYGSAGSSRSFGTISGHTLRTVRGSESMCTALIPSLKTNQDIVAKATLTGTIRGAIYFIQKDYGFDQLGNTLIIVDILSQGTRVDNILWKVYQGESPSSSRACSSSLTEVHNPFSASTGISSNSNYTSDCSPLTQLRCQSGDLSGKHGKISIGADIPSRPTYSFIDSNIQLTGGFSVVGMSLGLIDSSYLIFECATITRSYISADKVTVNTSRSTTVRSEVINVLAAEVNIDPSDILVLNHRVYQASGVTCVEMTFRTLGSTQEMADSNANKLNNIPPSLITSGALPSVSTPLITSGALPSVSVSVVTLILPLLVAIFLFTSKN